MKQSGQREEFMKIFIEGNSKLEIAFFDKEKQIGFTLMELLMALAIVGIVAVFGIPSMTQFLASKRTKKIERSKLIFRYKGDI